MNRILGAFTIAVHALFPTYVAAVLWGVLLIRDGLGGLVAAMPTREVI